MVSSPPKPADWIGASRKAKLEAVFGQFKEPELDLFRIQSEETYTAIPLHLGFHRASLYTEFKTEMTKRKTILDEIWIDTKAHVARTKDTFQEQKEKIKKIPMLRHDRLRVMETVRTKESEAIDLIRKDADRKRETVRKQIPYTSWVQFLQHKATQGNETALAILRSKKNLHPASAPDGEATRQNPEQNPDEFAQNLRSRL